MNKHLPAIYNHKTSACLKFHILLFLCPGRLAFLCLLLPDAFLPPFQVPLYGRFLSRLGGLAVLLGRQYLICRTIFCDVCIQKILDWQREKKQGKEKPDEE